MFPPSQLWKKLYLILIPFAALVTVRDAFNDFYLLERADSFRITLLYNVLVWALWLSLAPLILWLFQRILQRSKAARVPLIVLLAVGASALHQGLHHWIFGSTLEFVRLGWGTLMVAMLLGFLLALKLQDERRSVEMRALTVEKQVEEARLLQIQGNLDQQQLRDRLHGARATIEKDPEGSDQQLTDLADDLRAALKSFSGKLQPVEPGPVRASLQPTRRILWMTVIALACIVQGIVMTTVRILDDQYVWRYYILSWDACSTLFMSWFATGLMVPFIFWMNRRFPVETNAVPHIAACILFFFTINISLQFMNQPDRKLQAVLTQACSTGIAFGFKFDVYGAVLIAAVAFSRLESKRKEEIRLAEHEILLLNAQMEALKMQLHPHFLFNALNSIIELIHRNPRQAADLLERLDQFLEMTLRHARDVQQVPLWKELEFIECYMDMQKVRFPKRLTFTMDIDEKSKDIQVPVLILQPLVENAIRHGIAQNPQAGEITIGSLQRGGTLELRVQDTGPGIASENVQEGIGIQNTRRRLTHMYGKHFRFEMKNESRGGLLVYLEIPCP